MNGGRTPSPPSGAAVGNSASAQALPPACGARQLSKLKRFLTTLQQFGSDISPEIGERVRSLVLGLVVRNPAVSASIRGFVFLSVLPVGLRSVTTICLCIICRTTTCPLRSFTPNCRKRPTSRSARSSSRFSRPTSRCCRSVHAARHCTRLPTSLRVRQQTRTAVPSVAFEGNSLFETVSLSSSLSKSSRRIPSFLRCRW